MGWRSSRRSRFQSVFTSPLPPSLLYVQLLAVRRVVVVGFVCSSQRGGGPRLVVVRTFSLYCFVEA